MDTEDNSPCVGKCYVDTDIDLCTGCFRTIQEIIDWPEYSEEEKTSVLKKIKGRGYKSDLKK